MNKTVAAKTTWKGDMRVECEVRDHTIVIDQPADMGGSDAGPNPIEALLIALGSCQATMAAIIASQKRIDLAGFSIEIEGDYDLDSLMGKTEEEQTGMIEIRQKIFIDADLTDEEKKEFFEEVHARCPVTGSFLEKTQIKFEIE